MMPADGGPVCADPALLPLVDVAFTRSKVGNQAARELAVYCRRCPVAAACLHESVTGREHGVWGATRRALGYGGQPSGPLKVVA